MNCATMLVLCLALIQGKPDPVTGTWSGTMGPSATQQRSITMELKYDGTTITGAVTGMRPPADITKGTFNAETGGLNMEAIIQNEQKTVVVFTGKIVNGEATGTVVFGNNNGTFSVRKDAPPK